MSRPGFKLATLDDGNALVKCEHLSSTFEWSWQKTHTIIHIHDSICFEYISQVFFRFFCLTSQIYHFPLRTNTQLVVLSTTILSTICFYTYLWYLSCFVSRKFYGFEDRNMTFYNFAYIFLRTLCNFNAHIYPYITCTLYKIFWVHVYKIYDHIGYCLSEI